MIRTQLWWVAGVALLVAGGARVVLSQDAAQCDGTWPERLACFAAGDAASAGKINGNFKQLANWNVPVGAIVAWHKSLATDGLPAEWTECDGKTITDSSSPLDGQAVPNLNGQARFLRGGATSGSLQGDTMQGHRHGLNSGTIHLLQEVHPNGSYELYSSAHVGCAGCSAGYHDVYNTVAPNIGNPTTHSHGAPRVGSETRPTNMSVVWIMRIK